jgi:cytochrome b
MSLWAIEHKNGNMWVSRCASGGRLYWGAWGEETMRLPSQADAVAQLRCFENEGLLPRGVAHATEHEEGDP